MQTFRMANGVEIPAVGYGSYLSTQKGGEKVILDALEAGYRYIDTAEFYRNEKEIGEALSQFYRQTGQNRTGIFLCSKVWPTKLARKELLASFEESCRNLGTDYLDLYLIHWPKAKQNDEAWLDKVCEAWSAMEELYDGGRVRAIGLSNFLPHHIRPLLEKAKIRPMIDQLELHVGYMQEYALMYLQREGILPQAWSPIGRARMITDERICSIAGKYGKSPAQILLRFLNQRGIPVIPKASVKERMVENLNIFDFTLSEDEISYLSCVPQAGWSGEHPDLSEA
ncbi:MAG: aldo/keto reductase [Lachnospiraceae bacterium]|nr:aldo/keto reductase [Lachnospiraceae bacterium]